VNGQKVTTTDRWIAALKSRRVVAAAVIGLAMLAGIVAGASNLRAIIDWFTPTHALKMGFEIENNSTTEIALLPWCDIVVYESAAGVQVLYPPTSRRLSSTKARSGGTISIPAGEAVLVRLEVPIDDSYAEVYRRAAGTIVVTFTTEDVRHRFEAGWRFCRDLANAGPLRVTAYDVEEPMQ
jgi:hypothetical protein